MMRIASLWAMSLLLTCSVHGVEEAAVGSITTDYLIESITNALDLTKSTIHHIMHVWQVRSYPNFLQSSGVSADGWNLMKMKLQDKLLSAAVSGKRKKWVTAFMGSSVTAGRDSPVNASFVALTQKMMRAPFLAVGLLARSNQNAHEDVVHWEQSYFCDGNERIMEAFIRSAQLLPNKPIVIFSDSATENWEEKDCAIQPPPYVLTEADNSLLKTFHSSPKELFTTTNAKYDQHRQNHHFKDYYKAAGVQSFWHQDHQKYKCLGPFTKDWKGNCAGWHPSIKGNQLRAGHHVLIWLSIFKEALSETRKLLATMSIEEASKFVRTELDAYHKKNPLPPRRHNSDLVMPDNMQCWTNNEPRTDKSTSLTDALIDRSIAATLAANAIDLDTWYVVVADRIYYDDEIFHKNHVEIGYKDYKVSLVGNAASGPVSLFFTARSAGKMMICDVAQNWGALKTEKTSAGDYGKLYKYPPKVYATPSSATTRPESFVLDAKTAKLLTFVRYDDTDECVFSKEKVDKGPFVLTIVPTSAKKLLITYILVP